jgi:hypothetical protein
MAREKFDIPDQNILEWIEENFGLGGFANYDREQVVAFMEIIAKAVDVCGLVELDWLGKFFQKLSDDVDKVNTLLDELEASGWL